MRRSIVFLVLMLSSSPAHADPMLPGELFTPDAVFLNVGAPLFANGSNRFCWLCSDSDPGNNLLLVLGRRTPGTFAVQGFPGFFGADSLGGIAVNGPAPSFAGLNVTFSFRVTTAITTKVNPDHSTERLPRPSVAEGVVTGAVIGLPRRELELHYSGRVDGVSFQESSIDPFVVPIEGGSKSFTAEFFVDQEVPFTPGDASVIPEPMSLLLLGSGLAAAAITRRRRPGGRPSLS